MTTCLYDPRKWVVVQCPRSSQDTDQRRVAKQPRMKLRDLANNPSISQYFPDRRHHVINILALLHEAKATLEGDSTNDVKGIVLAPIRQFDLLTDSLAHLIDKNVGALVHIWLKGTDRRHGELLRDWLLERPVVGWVHG